MTKKYLKRQNNFVKNKEKHKRRRNATNTNQLQKLSH